MISKVRLNAVVLIILTALSCSTGAIGQGVDIPDDAHLSVKDMPFQRLIEFDVGRQISINRSSFKAQDVFLTIPYKYRNPVMLETTISELGTIRSTLRMKAGAEGYYAGRFNKVVQYNYAAYESLDSDNYGVQVWCFWGKDGRDAPKELCLSLDNGNYHQLLPTGNSMNLFVAGLARNNQFAIATPSIIAISNLQISEKSLHYKVKEAYNNKIVLALEENEFVTYNIPLSSDYIGIFHSPIGDISIKSNFSDNSFSIVKIAELPKEETQ